MSLYWFPLPLDFLLCKILGLHTCKVLRERPTTPRIVSSLVQTQGPVSPYRVMCESTAWDQYLLKEGLGFGPVKGPLLPGGDAVSPHAVALWRFLLQNSITRQDKDQQDSLSISDSLLST